MLQFLHSNPGMSLSYNTYNTIMYFPKFSAFPFLVQMSFSASSIDFSKTLQAYTSNKLSLNNH